MKTIGDLLRRAESAIDKREPFIYDVAVDSCQMVDNVAHMSWFRKAVANWLISNTTTYAHLKVSV